METGKHESKAPIAVLGAGSWGTALAMLIARNGRRTYLYCDPCSGNGYA